MKQYDANHIKNVALTGHGSSGKTTLAEAILYVAGATDRLGKVSDGNTVMDSDSEEKKRKVSVSTAVASLEWNNYKFNIIDAPGLFDFAAGVNEALRAAETAVIVLSGKSGLTVGAEKAYQAAKKQGLRRVFFVNKMNSERADYYKVVDSLKEAYGSSVCPVVVPYVVDHKVDCYINLVTGKAWRYTDGRAAQIDPPDFPELASMHDLLCEAVASIDEELMERYFSGDPLTADEIFLGLHKGVASGDITPVYAGSGQTCEGIDLLLNGMIQILPSADEAEPEMGEKNGVAVEVPVDVTAPSAAIIFKTIADPFVGKLSYFKVISGKISPASNVINARTGEHIRIGKVMLVQGGRQTDVDCICAGDIGAVAKLADVRTGDTLADALDPISLVGVDYPLPCLSMAIKPKNKGDEDKISMSVARLSEEDPSLVYSHNHETHERIISGQGEQHLDVAVSRLKNKFGLDVELSVPKVAYRETIRKPVKVQGKHKKQSGGHGQYGDVWIEFEPCDNDHLVFEEKVFGGSVPKNFFPAVEKGLQDSVKKGVLAGYPVVGLKATLVDGSYHPVDSSEMAFKTAASIAFKNGMAQASPVLLEPIGMLKALVPDDNMGDVIGEVNKLRGRVLGMTPMEDRYQEIAAEVPMAETGDFSTFLRQATQGRGNFTLDFERYEEAPPQVAQQVIDAAKTEGDAE